MPHIHEKIDWVVETFVVHKEKVLLRMHDKYKIWLSVGGHIELDENPNKAAIREVMEEVGLKVKLHDDLKTVSIDTKEHTELIPPKFLNIHQINSTHQHVCLVYFATATTDAVKPEKSEDVWRWVTEKELEKMDLRPHIKFYAQKALKELASQSTTPPQFRK